MFNDKIGVENFRGGRTGLRNPAEITDKNKRILYQLIEIDTTLSVANKENIYIAPAFDSASVWFPRIDAENSTNVSIRFNEIYNSPIYILQNDLIVSPFQGLYITYTQQPLGSGRVIRIYFSNDEQWFNPIRRR